MRIVVNHLTRMQRGYMCAAGVDMEYLCHVRPVSAAGRLSVNLLTRYGGPFDMAVILEFDSPQSISRKPEVEDKIINPSNIQNIGVLGPKKFWRFLTQVAETKLVNIFGEDLIEIGGSSCGVNVGKGKASLGCLMPKCYPSLYIKSRSNRPDQVRMQFTDGNFHLDCGVTDIRLYGNDHVTPNDQVIQGITQRLSNVLAILSMGLTRAYASREGLEPVHWLQVNNIHFQDDPTWQLG
jgi:hypothetical protein